MWIPRPSRSASRSPSPITSCAASDEPGNWRIAGGQWHLLSAWDADPHGNGERFANNVYAQNPFAWLGRADAHPAICTTGKTSWEDYTLSFAVQPRDGAVGALVNMSDARNGVLVRWSAANDPGPNGGAAYPVQLANGQRRELARAPGGYLPGLWYRLSVVSGLEGVQVLIDGMERLAATNDHPLAWLYRPLRRREARGGVRHPHRVRAHAEYRHDRRGAAVPPAASASSTTKKCRNGRRIGNRFSRQPGAYRHQRNFFGDQRLIMHVTPNNMASGSIAMVLNGDGEDFSTGYRAEVERGFDGKPRYTLYRNRRQLAVRGWPPDDG